MPLYRSIRERLQDSSGGLIGRDVPEQIAPLLPAPAPGGLLDVTPQDGKSQARRLAGAAAQVRAPSFGGGAQGIDPSAPDPEAPERGQGGFFQRLFAGEIDPNLSAEANEQIRRQAMLISGLYTLANTGERGLAAVPEGIIQGQVFAQQAKTRARGEMAEAARKANRERAMQVITQGDPSDLTPGQLNKLIMEGMQHDDGELVDFLIPYAERVVARQEAQEQALAQDIGAQTADRLIASVNSGQLSREEAFSELQEARAQGDPAADVALERLRTDSSQATLRRDRVRDDFQDEGEALEVRARSVRSGLDPTATDLELIASVMRAETGDTSISARNVTQFEEQGTRIGIAQEIWETFTKTSELTDPIRQQMRRRLRFLGSQVAREADSYERRLIQAATAERVFIDDLGVKLPSELLPELGPARTEAGNSRVNRMMDAAENLEGSE